VSLSFGSLQTLRRVVPSSLLLDAHLIGSLRNVVASVATTSLLSRLADRRVRRHRRKLRLQTDWLGNDEVEQMRHEVERVLFISLAVAQDSVAIGLERALNQLFGRTFSRNFKEAQDQLKGLIVEGPGIRLED
jgi:hypothetical protein